MRKKDVWKIVYGYKEKLGAKKIKETDLKKKKNASGGKVTEY